MSQNQPCELFPFDAQPFSLSVIQVVAVLKGIQQRWVNNMMEIYRSPRSECTFVGESTVHFLLYCRGLSRNNVSSHQRGTNPNMKRTLFELQCYRPPFCNLDPWSFPFSSFPLWIVQLSMGNIMIVHLQYSYIWGTHRHILYLIFFFYPTTASSKST